MNFIKIISNLFKPAKQKEEIEDNISKQESEVTDSTKGNWQEELHNLLELAKENANVNDSATIKYYTEAFQICKRDTDDFHFLLNELITFYYGIRNTNEDAINKCIEYCKVSIEQTPNFLERSREAYKETYGKNNYIPPRIPAFQRLAIIYQNQEKYNDAIIICKKALSLGLRDGTQSGFKGRIERLERKLKNSSVS